MVNRLIDARSKAPIPRRQSRYPHALEFGKRHSVQRHQMSLTAGNTYLVKFEENIFHSTKADRQCYQAPSIHWMKSDSSDPFLRASAANSDHTLDTRVQRCHAVE